MLYSNGSSGSRKCLIRIIAKDTEEEGNYNKGDLTNEGI